MALHIRFLLQQQYLIYDGVKIIGRTLTTEEQKNLDEWQIRWDTVTKGRWTHRLIADIQSWIDRRHGHVDFYDTVFDRAWLPQGISL